MIILLCFCIVNSELVSVLYLLLISHNDLYLDFEVIMLWLENSTGETVFILFLSHF